MRHVFWFLGLPKQEWWKGGSLVCLKNWAYCFGQSSSQFQTKMLHAIYTQKYNLQILTGLSFLLKDEQNSKFKILFKILLFVKIANKLFLASTIEMVSLKIYLPKFAFLGITDKDVINSWTNAKQQFVPICITVQPTAKGLKENSNLFEPNDLATNLQRGAVGQTCIQQDRAMSFRAAADQRLLIRGEKSRQTG